MKYKLRSFKEGDFVRIRDFLVYTYKEFQKPYNWTIDQWNFSLSLSRVMNGVSVDDWEDKIGIWENESDEIVSIAHCSGEEKGISYFELPSVDLPDDLLEEMFDFVESKVPIKEDDKLKIYHITSDWDKKREEMLKNRGYKKINDFFNQEMSIENRPSPSLHKDFSIVEGNEVSDLDKGHAHGKAFGYFDTPYIERSPVGYLWMKKMPDYKSNLDLYVVSDTNEIVSFCTLWYDVKNKIGILEPVGTIPEYRKMGLGRSVIAEAIDRIAKTGAEKVFVGSSQDFYTAIGFEKKHRVNVWEKIFE